MTITLPAFRANLESENRPMRPAIPFSIFSRKSNGADTIFWTAYLRKNSFHSRQIVSVFRSTNIFSVWSVDHSPIDRLFANAGILHELSSKHIAKLVNAFSKDPRLKSSRFTFPVFGHVGFALDLWRRAVAIRLSRTRVLFSLTWLYGTGFWLSRAAWLFLCRGLCHGLDKVSFLFFFVDFFGFCFFPKILSQPSR